MRAKDVPRDISSRRQDVTAAGETLPPAGIHGVISKEAPVPRCQTRAPCSVTERRRSSIRTGNVITCDRSRPAQNGWGVWHKRHGWRQRDQRQVEQNATGPTDQITTCLSASKSRWAHSALSLGAINSVASSESCCRVYCGKWPYTNNCCSRGSCVPIRS